MVTTNRILPGQARLEQYRTVYSNNYQNQCEKQLETCGTGNHMSLQNQCKNILRSQVLDELMQVGAFNSKNENAECSLDHF